AAGKSNVALWLAERHHVTIVSADSRQVYRGFDVGTAKPTAQEQARVPHRGIDVVEPTERYSAAAWAAGAADWMAEAAVAGRAPLVVGGTGLYVRALFEPLFEEPPLGPTRRRALEVVLGRLPLPELQRWCAALDPARAHLGRTQLLRAIEVALLTGRRLSALHAERRRPARRRARYLVVDPGPSLHERIARRTAAMLDEGWPEEVESLVRRVPPTAPAWNASGYGHVRDLVEGRLSRQAAQEAIVIETRQYAKRQRTWFRHQLPAESVRLVDPSAPDWEAVVDTWWNEERTP
ncbi:MAG TPA: tRNA (adenosine(37)-N6)-dimethylallyltransferase MiaA, partial [Gemmatimonadaceae bacterium]|nr:tRNA (adenosine(37)-N6)-dimethylallyltransferase MiaA [Gemmatimonadaceae bacterium]